MNLSLSSVKFNNGNFPLTSTCLWMYSIYSFTLRILIWVYIEVTFSSLVLAPTPKFKCSSISRWMYQLGVLRNFLQYFAKSNPSPLYSNHQSCLRSTVAHVRPPFTDQDSNSAHREVKHRHNCQKFTWQGSGKEKEQKLHS